MKILTAAEMRTADRLTSEKFGVTPLQLMESAGQAVAAFVEAEFHDARRVTVLCGKGNNGGDGFVAARALAQAGREVRVLLLGRREELKGDAESMFQRLDTSASGVRYISAADEAAVASEELQHLLADSDLLLDAVVGTGFVGSLRGPAAALRDAINKLRIPVVAIDVPSGWDADSRDFSVKGAFRANAVVTFTAPKLAHMFGNLTGSATTPILVAPIGSPEEAVQSNTGLTWAGSSKRLVEAPRSPDSNKGKFGHVLVVAGSRGKAGAPAMASLAALRAGAGLVTAAIPESILPTVSRVAPELMTLPLIEGHRGEISSKNLEPENLKTLLERRTVLAIGPGLGQEKEAAKFLIGLIRESNVPAVIDADALNILADHLDMLEGRGRTLVLTPHPGEMARLAGISVKEVQADRERLARDFAVRHQITLVLKGWRTLIAHPDGSIAVNTTGNPGMAKGGSGDILTGIIAAILAQHPDQVAEAVNAAVYLHGLAADFALREFDEHTLLATDTVSHLSSAFRFRQNASGGYVWIQGIPSGLVAQPWHKRQT
jgi:ADP-dependent NAD(P)H-hydrate dehydratase / NAD(P)H-hydrate epimerase